MTIESLSLRELYIDHLREIYSAESQIIETLPSIIHKTTSPKLTQELKEYLEETKGQIARLQQIFESLHEDLNGKKSVGMEKLLERVNHEINKQTNAFRLLDKTLIELCQKMTHYEILAYGTVIAFAELLKDTRALALLMKTLEEEKAVEEKLIQFGSTDLIRMPDAFGNPKLEGPTMREELNTNDSLGG